MSIEEVGFLVAGLLLGFMVGVLYVVWVHESGRYGCR